MDRAGQLTFELTEQGYVPDLVIRRGIRYLLKQRLREIQTNDAEKCNELLIDFVSEMRRAPIALLPERANEQHYEVPAEFFENILGGQLKYSCCYWPSDAEDLDSAEVAALRLTCEHAELNDGQSVLELGCGWGSLSLWMAQQYPNSSITAVSNSHSQRQYIEAQAKRRGLSNLIVITSDMNEFSTDQRFDSIVSVEMFEHMRNWEQLFKRVAGWLDDNGRFFMHVFCHRSTPYAFVDNGSSDWMSRHFFSGGMMPSDDLALFFPEHLQIDQRWRWSGEHYKKTAEAWLANMDAHKTALWPVLESTYGESGAQKWWMRWRIFFLACAEMFGYDNGQQWWVSHYRFTKRIV
jgi:cyclopropane-fatty-acyl-phospholipid synthase